MASTSKCKFCGAAVRSDERNCPNCGAANESFVADTPRQIFLPKTIVELKEYCAERGMPLLKMRFFIDENYREPRAFGIYRDGNDFVVYKNKSDGSRAVRYRGPDEAYAVNELFQKLLEECHNRGIYPDGKPANRSHWQGNSGRSSGRSGSGEGKWAILIVVLFLIAILIGAVSARKRGYYKSKSGSAVYYHIGSDWYRSYGSGSWSETYAPSSDDVTYVGDSFSSGWGVSNFRDSSAYREYESSHSSSSSDYDSWDSGDTDWDSDW